MLDNILRQVLGLLGPIIEKLLFFVCSYPSNITLGTILAFQIRVLDRQEKYKSSENMLVGPK